jgi:hypothetical protein
MAVAYPASITIQWQRAIAHDHAKYAKALPENFNGQIRLNFGAPKSKQANFKIHEVWKLLKQEILAQQVTPTPVAAELIAGGGWWG